MFVKWYRHSFHHNTDLSIFIAKSQYLDDIIVRDLTLMNNRALISLRDAKINYSHEIA